MNALRSRASSRGVDTLSALKIVASGNRVAGSRDLIPGFHGPYSAPSLSVSSGPDGPLVALGMRSGPV